jgi:hypothetical protein
MSITTTLGTLADAEPILTDLGTKKLPVKSAYLLAKMTRLVRTETELFHEKRNEYITELGTERAATPEEATKYGPKVRVLLPENAPEFLKRMSELATIEVTLACDALPIDALSTIELSAAEIDRLGPLVTMQ